MRTSLLRLAISVVALSLLLGCANKYMVRDENGRLIDPKEDRCRFLDTEFERSLCDEFENPYDTVRVTFFAQRYLLAAIARREGPASEPDRLLNELDRLHVRYDSARVRAIFRQGLAELERGHESGDEFISSEIPKRVACLLQLKCFLPESRPHFDELGQLILLHGCCQTETWTETTVTVSFPDGTYYWIGEDEYLNHRVLLAASSHGDMSRQKDRLLLESDAESGGGSTLEDIADNITSDMEVFAESSELVMEQWSEIGIDVDYDWLELATTNVHRLPTPYGHGAWDGQPSRWADSLWLYNRNFVDLYLNLREIDRSLFKTAGQVSLTIDYALLDPYRLPIDTLLSEQLTTRFDPRGADPDDGLSLRFITGPYRSTDQTQELRFDLMLTVGDKSSVERQLMTIEPNRYEITLPDPDGEASNGIPTFRRINEIDRGGQLDILMPITNLPPIGNEGQFEAIAYFFLTPNKSIGDGRVTVSDSRPWDSLAPSPEDSEANSVAGLIKSAYFLDSELIGSRTRNVYYQTILRIPRELPSGLAIDRGEYTLTALIVAEGRTVCEASLRDLRIE